MFWQNAPQLYRLNPEGMTRWCKMTSTEMTDTLLVIRRGGAKAMTIVDHDTLKSNKHVVVVPCPTTPHLKEQFIIWLDDLNQVWAGTHPKHAGSPHQNEQDVHTASPGAQTLNLRHKGQVLTSLSYLHEEKPAGFACSNLDNSKADFGVF